MKKYIDFILEKSDNVIKLIDFPNLRQSTTFTCGAVATQAILAYYGIDIRESDIAKKLKSNKDGTYIVDIIDFLHKNKLKTDAKENMSIDDLKEFIDKDIPVMILIQAYGDVDDYSDKWNSGHNVVAIGYTKNKIIFSDPSAYKNTYLNNNKLLQCWHDKEGDKKYIKFGLAVYGMKPKYDSKKIQKIS